MVWCRATWSGVTVTTWRWFSIKRASVLKCFIHQTRLKSVRITFVIISSYTQLCGMLAREFCSCSMTEASPYFFLLFKMFTKKWQLVMLDKRIQQHCDVTITTPLANNTTHFIFLFFNTVWQSTAFIDQFIDLQHWPPGHEHSEYGAYPGNTGSSLEWMRHIYVTWKEKHEHEPWATQSSKYTHSCFLNIH